MSTADSGPASGLTSRRAVRDDLPRLAELIASGDLPPLFIEQYLAGFVVIEREGELVAGGGIEIYDDCAVIRSVVVDAKARGQALGRHVAETLMSDAREAGAADLYLFTQDARPFWERLGFAVLGLNEWRAPARACWQYQFIAQNQELMPEIYSMWRRA